MNFSARLQQLPTVTHLAALQLADAQGQVVATIENKPGQTGSLAVYHALAALYGGSITPAAAELGLEWYADRKSTRLNSSHLVISYAVFCLKKKKNHKQTSHTLTHSRSAP